MACEHTLASVVVSDFMSHPAKSPVSALDSEAY